MKRIKFLRTVSCEGEPVWIKNRIYDVIEEGTNSQGKTMLKLICEDSQIRGIDIKLKNDFFEIVENTEKEIITIDIPKIEEKVEPKKTTKKRSKKK